MLTVVHFIQFHQYLDLTIFLVGAEGLQDVVGLCF